VAGTPQFIEPSARKLSFEALCALLVADYKEQGRRSRLGAKLTQLHKFFGGWTTLAIITAHVNAYKKARTEAGKKPATINRELAALRRAFALAVEGSLLPPGCVLPTIKLLPEKNARQGFLDPPEFAAFLGELRQRDPVVADVAEFGFHLGLLPELTLSIDPAVHRVAIADLHATVNLSDR